MPSAGEGGSTLAVSGSLLRHTPATRRCTELTGREQL